MSKRTVELFLIVSLASGVGACSSNVPNSGALTSSPAEVEQGGEGGEGAVTQDLAWAGTFQNGAIVANFAQKVVVPSYQSFQQNTDALERSLTKFAQQPSDATLTEARETWKQVRANWEKTESFAFGPAGSLGYDAALDSWPVNEVDVTQILQSQQAITPENIVQLQETQKGMHAIELLLFGQRNDKRLDQFQDGDRQYLSALGVDLHRVATALLESWQSGVNGQPAYTTVISSAGEDGNAIYPTASAGAQEMVTGILDCIAEVEQEKLGTPIAEKSSDNLESRFSFNTLADLQNNIAGAQAVYFGNLGGKQPSSESLSAYIAQKNPSLDKTIKTQFQQALTELKSLPAPLETSINQPSASGKLASARQALTALQKTIESQVVPLI